MTKNRLIVIVAPLHSEYSEREEEEETDTMNTEMGSALPTEKLDRNNFASWEYKMHQYLVRQGYWSYIEGAHVDQPVETAPKYATWVQAASRVMYFLATCVHDHMLGYIREAKTSKEAWENLRKIFSANKTTRRLQLRQELNIIQQRDMSMTTYTLKIKDLCARVDKRECQ